jgi:hypothetical protein
VRSAAERCDADASVVAATSATASAERARALHRDVVSWFPRRARRAAVAHARTTVDARERRLAASEQNELFRWREERSWLDDLKDERSSPVDPIRKRETTRENQINQKKKSKNGFISKRASAR